MCSVTQLVSRKVQTLIQPLGLRCPCCGSTYWGQAAKQRWALGNSFKLSDLLPDRVKNLKSITCKVLALSSLKHSYSRLIR